MSKRIIALALLTSVVGFAAHAEQKAGVWTRQDYKIAGTWSIVEEHGKLYVKLSDDFETKPAPDLKIFLSPLEPDALTGKNAGAGSALVAPLRSTRGAQSYVIPPGVDPSRFKSIVIQCEKYSKLWGAASL